MVRGGSSGGQEVHELIENIDGHSTYPSVYMAMDREIDKVRQYHNQRMANFFVSNRPSVRPHRWSSPRWRLSSPRGGNGAEANSESPLWQLKRCCHRYVCIYMFHLFKVDCCHFILFFTIFHPFFVTF